MKPKPSGGHSINNSIQGKRPFVTGQTLFETSWLADGTYNPFPTFDYTGPLRPAYPLSPTRIVPSHIPRPDYADNGK